MGKQNRIIALNDYSEDANGTTEYVITAEYAYEEGDSWNEIQTTTRITEATFFSKKQALKARKVLKDDGYLDSVEIKIFEDGVYYSVTPKIAVPHFLEENLGFRMAVSSVPFTIGRKMEYNNPKEIIDYSKGVLNTTYRFKTKKEAEIFKENNLQNGYDYLLSKFSLIKY